MAGIQVFAAKGPPQLPPVTCDGINLMLQSWKKAR
jgi:hypothetical protein